MKAILYFLIAQNASALVATGGEVNFTAHTKPAFINIKGTGLASEGTIEEKDKNVSGKFDFALDSLNTGINKRNEHMKERYLETAKFPKASFVLEAATRGQPDFRGKLTLHGVTQPIRGSFDLDDKGKIDAKFKIKLTDYKIEQPSFAGVTVTDDVDVEVKIDQLK